MKLLIAGFGDLGSTLAQTCLTTPGWQQTKILAVRRNPPAATPDTEISWIKADLSKAETLAGVAEQARDITHVVYCAAPGERTEAAYRATYLTGLQSLLTALNTAEPRPQLLFVSSTAVYDSQAQGLLDESSPTAPRGFNGKILLEAEHWLQTNWPSALILRLSGIYGPGKSGLLGSIAAGTTTIPASPDFVANRIHIEDAARAILHLFDRKASGVFIGTDSHPMPLATLYRKLAAMLGAPEPKQGEPSPMMGKKRLSNQKLLSTGFKLKWPDSLAGHEALIASRTKKSNR
ncbi:MAG: sugar nucleotide-binding protein [Burkholderiaceae bacterium]|nr:sugar nucleotide-binding protein [Burkholderiaceae bacterium]